MMAMRISSDWRQLINISFFMGFLSLRRREAGFRWNIAYSSLPEGEGRTDSGIERQGIVHDCRGARRGYGLLGGIPVATTAFLERIGHDRHARRRIRRQ